MEFLFIGKMNLISCYRTMKDELGSDFPDELLQEIFTKAIYELPFDEHVRLITEKWNCFKEEIFIVILYIYLNVVSSKTH